MAELTPGGWLIEIGASAGSEHGGGLQNVLWLDTDFHHVPQRGVDVVLHPSEFDLAILNHGIAAAPVTIARLSDAAGVENLDAVDFDQKLQVSMSDTDDVGFDSA